MGKVSKIGNAGAFGKLSKIEKPIRAIFPSKGSAVVAAAFNQTIPPIQITGDLETSEKENWHKIDDLCQTISEGVVQIASNLLDNINVVRQAGELDNVDEFNRNVDMANKDLERFTSELLKIKNRHAGKTGYIDSPEELSLYMSIFEDYRAFYTYFESSMQHTLINFTDYALQAKDRILARIASEAEESKEVPGSTAEVATAQQEADK